MKIIKSSPVVIHLKKFRRLPPGALHGPKKGPEPSHRGGIMSGPPAQRHEVDPESIQSARATALGDRFRIDEHRGFILDGRPASLDQVMRETNRIRKQNGLEPVGRNPAWL